MMLAAPGVDCPPITPQREAHFVKDLPICAPVVLPPTTRTPGSCDRRRSRGEGAGDIGQFFVESPDPPILANQEKPCSQLALALGATTKQAGGF
jgi:hypothetical protein